MVLVVVVVMVVGVGLARSSRSHEHYFVPAKSKLIPRLKVFIVRVFLIAGLSDEAERNADSAVKELEGRWKVECRGKKEVEG